MLHPRTALSECMFEILTDRSWWKLMLDIKAYFYCTGMHKLYQIISRELFSDILKFVCFQMQLKYLIEIFSRRILFAMNSNIEYSGTSQRKSWSKVFLIFENRHSQTSVLCKYYTLQKYYIMTYLLQYIYIYIYIYIYRFKLYTYKRGTFWSIVNISHPTLLSMRSVTNRKRTLHQTSSVPRSSKITSVVLFHTNLSKLTIYEPVDRDKAGRSINNDKQGSREWAETQTNNSCI